MENGIIQANFVYFTKTSNCKLCPENASRAPREPYLRIYKKKARYKIGLLIGGEAEIRTLGGVAPSTVFKTAALNHSATSPTCFVVLEMFLTKRIKNVKHFLFYNKIFYSVL